jgi:hypothetical protein
MVEPLSLGNIEAAARLIGPEFVRTPQYVDATLSGAVGHDLLLKIETFNAVRSFKGRGADYFMRGLDPRRHGHRRLQLEQSRRSQHKAWGHERGARIHHGARHGRRDHCLAHRRLQRYDRCLDRQQQRQV